VRVTTAVVTVLALAGAVATATLIFAAGLSVLWPVLIACACLTVLCAVGFLIAHCIVASGKAPSVPSGPSQPVALDLFVREN
jgi:hypothetical protein